MFTLWEIIQIVITIFAVGFIFSGIAPRRHSLLLVNGEELELSQESGTSALIKEIKFGAAIAAPAVIFHELAHKFLALAYGFSATYIASWWGLSIGVLLKLFSPGFIFFIPGYVSISGLGTAVQYGLVSIVGPATNLFLFLLFWLFCEKNIAAKYAKIWHVSKQINLWLFVFNMLPIPGLDGFKFYATILQGLF